MRKKIKPNPELLNEEIKRIKLLSEFTFYQEERNPEDNIDRLILGDEMGLEEADEDASADAAADDFAKELGVDAPEGNEEPAEAPAEEPVDAEASVEEPVEEPVEDTSDDVEVDVTSLVQGSEEAKMAADRATQNTELLLQKLTDLESRISSMDAVSGKIDALEKEIVKRNPTPLEKLDVQVKKSFPYSQRLEDYWADKTDYINGEDKEPEEYTLTQDEIDTTYSEPDIKKSFAVRPDDENEFTEEDI